MAEKHKSWFSGLLHCVVWWMETYVLEAMLHPSSEMKHENGQAQSHFICSLYALCVKNAKNITT
jgi:hypothetical protein